MPVYVDERSFASSELLKHLEESLAGAGAIVSFSGHVRPKASDKSVKGLFLQDYKPMTEQGITNKLEEACRIWPLTHVLVRHRTGFIPNGEAIVFVAVASVHRRDAFLAADFLMDYLKTEAVFWKKEITDTSAHWVEPRTEDYDDQARWTKLTQQAKT